MSEIRRPEARRPETGSLDDAFEPSDRLSFAGTLTHFRLCPHSRSIRLALGELRLDAAFVEEQPWAWQAAFLALNPAGELPVLSLDTGESLCGAYAISEYLAEASADAATEREVMLLFTGGPGQRAEVRRLVDWFHNKFYREVTRELLAEKVYTRLNPDNGAPPDPGVLRVAIANLRYHLSYIGYLSHERGWLAGDLMSFADLAAGAHLSVIDYLGDVPWPDYPAAMAWYQRLKSRPSMRPILADRLPGMPPPDAYADLEF